MKFIKRTTTPTKDNKYYGQPDPFISSGFGMFQNKGNCTDYAYCRFREAQQDINASNNLPTNNAENWFNKVKSTGAYKVGQVPKVGAIVVWSKGKIGNSKDGAGHVAIVEEVYVDGSFLTSNSGYKSSLFYTKKIKSDKSLKGYKFEGFIYSNVEFENEWTIGTYKLLKSKYIRTSPKVADNYVLVKNCMASVKPKLTSIKGTDKAKFKAGITVDITGFATDSKGNLWGKMKNTYICLNDSTGKQATKV